jgi:predicted GIY-YIG superfamily endonuclease
MEIYVASLDLVSCLQKAAATVNETNISYGDMSRRVSAHESRITSDFTHSYMVLSMLFIFHLFFTPKGMA